MWRSAKDWWIKVLSVYSKYTDSSLIFLGKHLFQEQAAWLEKSSEEEEIKEVVFSLVADISTGPRWTYNGAFQECRQIIKSDLNYLFGDFHKQVKVSQA